MQENANFIFTNLIDKHTIGVQSYHVSLDVELPDGMTNEQIQCKIAETFALARASVEAELHPVNAVKPSFNPHPSHPQQTNYGN